MGRAVIASNQSIKVEPIAVSQSYPSTIVTGNYQLVFACGSTSYVDLAGFKVTTGSSIRVTIGISPTDFIYQNLFTTSTVIGTFNTSNKLIVPCGASVWIDTATAGSAVAFSGTRFINSP